MQTQAELIAQSIKETRAALRKMAKAQPAMQTTGAYQMASRYAKDAAMFLKKGTEDCTDVAQAKAWKAKEALQRAEALAVWNK